MIGFTYDENVSGYEALKSAILRQSSPSSIVPSDPFEAWARWKRQFEAGAERYRKKSGKVPVLIIDNVNWFTNEDNDFEKSKKFLAEIQDRAKEWADEKKVKVVFVSSTGNAIHFMQGRSSWSRCDSVMEIGDIPFEDATKYLEHKGLTKEIAAKCVSELSGGRVSLLKMMAASLSSGMKYEQLKVQQMEEVRGDFVRAGFYLDDTQGKYIKSIVQELLNKDGKISITSAVIQSHFKDLFPMLLSSQVIAHHVSDNSITFESQRAATFAKAVLTKDK